MLNYTIEELEQRFEEAKENVENSVGNFEEEVYQLEQDLDFEIEMLKDEINSIPLGNSSPLEKTFLRYKKLADNIKDLKDENGFFDSEGELDRMFPNRRDEDFDDDSISYDNVFGDD